MKIARSLAFALSIGLGLAAAVLFILRWVPFGEYPGDAFFDLAAQTIPILLVALAVETQARRFDLEEAGKRIRIAAVIFLACGETAAVAVAASLYVPERGTLASDLLIVVTAVGLLGGFFAVIAIALKASPTAVDPPMQSGAERGRVEETGRFEQPPESVTARDPLVPILAGALLSATLLSVIPRRDRR